jgi:two-component system cell cycle response regulator DivK
VSLDAAVAMTDILTGESVLVVDDEPANLRLLAVLLTRNGYQVHEARTAEEALEMVENIRPRLVLADIQLPGIDGLEMTRRLKSNPETKDIVVVAVTAFAMKGDEQKALDAGCDGYITKPIDVTSLPRILRKYFRQ